MRCAVLALACLAAPAAAENFLPFQTPGGNIHCVIVHGGDRNYVRCDIVEGQLSFPDAPADCDLDWGQAFEVAERGHGRVLCAGDSVVNPDIQVMDPGYSHGIGGVICFSEPDAKMTCMNAEGHGFSLNADLQTIF